MATDRIIKFCNLWHGSSAFAEDDEWQNAENDEWQNAEDDEWQNAKDDEWQNAEDDEWQKWVLMSLFFSN